MRKVCTMQMYRHGNGRHTHYCGTSYMCNTDCLSPTHVRTCIRRITNQKIHVQQKLFMNACIMTRCLSTLSGSHDVKDRDIRLHKQASELRARTAERERLQKIVNQHQRTQDRLRQEVEFRMYSLKVRGVP